MGYKEVKKPRSKYNRIAQITIHPTNFYLNAAVVKQAELQNKVRVNLFVDEEGKRLAFKFLRNCAPEDGYEVYFKSGKPRARYISALEAYKHNPWLKKISVMQDSQDRRFTVVETERDYWEAQLAPSFENSCSRGEYASIPSDAIGIYRYLDEGRVVYIGEGNIRKRFQSPERTDWYFDRIEYSMLADKDQCTFWEKYWIDKFRSDNDEGLPRYNRNGGYTSKSSNRLSVIGQH
jgi:hypothetical protein